MNFLSFLFGLLCLASIDVILGFVIYVFWRYFDEYYFSKSEIHLLKEENKYLKEQNSKLGGISANFWSDK